MWTNSIENATLLDSRDQLIQELWNPTARSIPLIFEGQARASWMRPTAASGRANPRPTGNPVFPRISLLFLVAAQVAAWPVVQTGAAPGPAARTAWHRLPPRRRCCARCPYYDAATDPPATASGWCSSPAKDEPGAPWALARSVGVRHPCSGWRVRSSTATP